MGEKVQGLRSIIDRNKIDRQMLRTVEERKNRGEKVQGRRSIDGRYKIDRGRLRIV